MTESTVAKKCGAKQTRCRNKSGADMTVVPKHLGSGVTGSEMTGADFTRVRFV